MTAEFNFRTIGIVRSPCKEKFAVPRQAGLVPELPALVEIVPEFIREEAFAQLEGFSHIWLLSVFHQALRDDWQPSVRPPRLGGNRRVGVFASRSPFRPNPIGLSLVELEGIERHATGIALRIKGCDLVDGTPVLDIKPYLPYADFEPNAQAGYTREFAMDSLPVSFSDAAQRACMHYEQRGYANLVMLIARLIQQDPRPAYIEDNDERQFAFRLYEFDVVFHVSAGEAMVDELRLA